MFCRWCSEPQIPLGMRSTKQYLPRHLIRRHRISLDFRGGCCCRFNLFERQRDVQSALPLVPSPKCPQQLEGQSWQPRIRSRSRPWVAGTKLLEPLPQQEVEVRTQSQALWPGVGIPICPWISVLYQSLFGLWHIIFNLTNSELH